MPTVADLEAKYFPLDPAVIPHSQDTEVIAHIDGVAYFAALAAAISATSGTGDVIYIVGWVFDPDTTLLAPETIPAPPSIKELLATKAAAGVDVRIVLWAGRNQLPDNATDFGELAYWMNRLPDYLSFKNIVAANLRAARTLRTYERPGGAKPLEFSVLLDWSGAWDGSRHQKYAVVYNRTTFEMRAFVGGMDITTERRTTPDHNPPLGHDPSESNPNSWHDAGVELIGGAAVEVWADFRTRWNETRHLKPQTYLSPSARGTPVYFNPPDPHVTVIAGPAPTVISPLALTSSVRIVRSYAAKKHPGDDIPWDTTPPAGGLRQILSVYAKAIDRATRYIYVEDQGLNNAWAHTSHRTLFPLIGAAVLRNPALQVVFVCSGEGPDYTYVADLLSELRLPPSTPNFMMCRVNGVFVHSKVVLIDDEFAAVGSANFWDRSMEGDDTELTAAIVDSGTWVRDFRVNLMAAHFGVTDATVKSLLNDVDQAFALFFPTAPYPAGFAHPDSRLFKVYETGSSIRI